MATLLFLFCVVSGLSTLQGARISMNEVTNCTSGFPSRERMYAVLNRPNSHQTDTQAIIPSMNFTCNGSISSWIIAANLGKLSTNSTPFTELQIWRRERTGEYKRVVFTEVMSKINSSKVYYHNLASPMVFQAGDIIGYYQSGNKHRILFGRVNSGQTVYYHNNQESSSSTFNESGSRINDRDHALITVIADPADCVCGFMSAERIEYLVKPKGDLVYINERLQITPEMMFTCNGMITKWIIGAKWNDNGQVYPELQIWRKTGEESYEMMNKTEITSIESEVNTKMYEYSAFSPIPVQPGFVLGLLTPPNSNNTLLLRGEESDAPINYFVELDELQHVSLVSFNSQGMQSAFHPQVTVEIVPMPSTEVKSMPTHATVSLSIMPSERGGLHRDQDVSGVEGIGIGVGLTALVLLAAIATLVVVVCLHRRKRVYKTDVPVVAFSNTARDETTTSVNDNVNTLVWEQSQDHARCNDSTTDYQILTCPTYYNETGTHLTVLNIPEGHYEMSDATLPTVVDYYVPNAAQRQNYRSVDEENGSFCNEDFFAEKESFWSPGGTLAVIYDQLSHHKFREISRRHIEIGGSLGSGEFGIVSRGKWLGVVCGPVEVAIKTLRPAANEDSKVRFLQEAAVIGQFKHPNIVKLHGVVTMDDPMMIVMEFMAHGDLRNYPLITSPEPPEQSELAQLCLSFSRQIASGMSYLADKGFVHRDLAARNILISDNQICKVADFGLSRGLDNSGYYISSGGMIPVKWTAPEAIHYKKYTTASDVWSFGCVMYEIWSVGHKPFEGLTNTEVMEKVVEGYRLSPPPGCPRQIYSLMINCWHPDSHSRPSFPSLCQTLAEEAGSLLELIEPNDQDPSQASLLGAPLQAGAELYLELQKTYQ